MQRFCIIIFIFFIFLFTGCAHNVSKGFDVYLKEHPTKIVKIDKEVGYTIDDKTKNMIYEFRSFTTGIANKWVINVGRMLSDYLRVRGKDLFKKCEEDISKTAYPLHLHFKINSYSFSNFQAHINMKITVYKNGVLLFEKNYTADGARQGGKMFWGGAFAQRHAVHQSTQIAFDKIMNQFITDLKTKLENLKD